MTQHPKSPRERTLRERDSREFQRLMLLIATLVRHPGVGYQTLDPSENYHSGKDHNALTEVQERVRELAATLALGWPAEYPSIATLRKDITTLRDYKILDRHIYRWGYYLGTGVMSPDELKIAFDALRSRPSIRVIRESVRSITNSIAVFKGLHSAPELTFSIPSGNNSIDRSTIPIRKR
ncbi:hypothetical protein [Microcystis aeruginosa]|uniref:hypothetical protein n=1 Tax=Microcystis aeruginosa TaxID=1126 RepID=UPI0021CC70A6|nr:hypothetical protein [Microcystis aeruginosa]